MIDAQQGVVLARAFEPLTKAIVRTFEKHEITTMRVIDTANDESVDHPLAQEGPDPQRGGKRSRKSTSASRPGEPPTTANAKALLKRLFFDPKRYDLGRVGRYKVNQKLGLKTDLETRILNSEDVVESTKYLVSSAGATASSTTSTTSAPRPRAHRGRASRSTSAAWVSPAPSDWCASA